MAKTKTSHRSRVVPGLAAALMMAVGLGCTAPATAAQTEAGAHAAGKVPAALRPALYRLLARKAAPRFRLDGRGCLTLRELALRGCFDAGGARFERHGGSLGLHLAAWGRRGALHRAAAVTPRIRGNRVRYAHDGVTEWWRVLPVGFEQGFTVARRPAGNGPLVVALDATSPGRRRGDSLRFGALRYSDLVVTDGAGAVVPATLDYRHGRVLITVRDSGAHYPLTIDPIVTSAQEVSASDAVAGDDFGVSVAVSGDVAMIGAIRASFQTSPPLTDNGAVYVFTKSGGTWSQTQKLTGSDVTPAYEFGISVALDGKTAVVGAPGASDSGNNGEGAAYVFKESGGTWSQTQKLVPAGGGQGDEFGTSVAFDGTTIVSGAVCAHLVSGQCGPGAAYVFTDSGGTWSQAAELTASDGAAGDSFGFSVAVDGGTVLVGASGATIAGNAKQGAAYIFTGSGSSWTQSKKLVAADGSAQDGFGYTVALDSGQALVFGGDSGGLYVFTGSGSSWAQSQKLTVSNGLALGWTIGVDGDTMLVGQPRATVGGNSHQGKVYVFTRLGGSWSQSGALTASDGAANDWFGYAVALDAGGAVVGAPKGLPSQTTAAGKAYLYDSNSGLSLSLDAPASAPPAGTYLSQAMATNSASVTSAAVSVTMTVPAHASFVSVNATQGSCSQSAGMVTCDLGAVAGNGGTATANLTLAVTGSDGDIIDNTATLTGTPPIEASTQTAVSATNHAPVASDGAEATVEGQSVDGVLPAVDPDGDPITFSIVSGPSHGTVTINDASTGAFTYTPDSGFTGNDSFTFKASDGTLDSNVATETVVVASASGGLPGGGLPGSGGGGGLGWLAVAALALLVAACRLCHGAGLQTFERGE